MSRSPRRRRRAYQPLPARRAGGAAWARTLVVAIAFMLLLGTLAFVLGTN